MEEGEENFIQGFLVRKPEGNRPLGRPRYRWEDNIKMVKKVNSPDNMPYMHRGVQRYSCTLSITSALQGEGGGWSTPCHGPLSLEKARYPSYRTLGEPQRRSGHWGKSCPDRGLNPEPSSS
jgi:hypothetical protein